MPFGEINPLLPDWAAEFGVRTPLVPPHCEQSYHLYYLILPSMREQREFIARLKSRGILSLGKRPEVARRLIR
jgi:dTDP-4-amino-4,6-dideoxygalactose transaminase